jgi:acyl-CoA synthetase (AMP-forming)/AMP-acid ligase II
MMPILSSMFSDNSSKEIVRSSNPCRLKKLLETGATIESSGTTGIPKNIFRDPKNLKVCNEVAINAQELTRKSSVYTVTRLSHAGGLLAQSLPALSIDANVEFDTFNPYSFFRKFSKHTHTFLPPDFMESLTQTKSFKNADFGGRRILTGSSPVNLETIKKFVARNAVVQPNWGMSEIGPIVINDVFNTLEEVELAQKKCPKEMFYLGSSVYCDLNIVNDELHVRGPMSIYEGWFPTGDLVSKINADYYFLKRLCLI